MGPAPRAGACTYDWIENRPRLDMHSANRILEGFPAPKIGDAIAYGPNRMRLERIETERAPGWRSGDGNWVWSFALNDIDGDTRLISRNRFRLPSVVTRVTMLPMEPASLVVERKMLAGIKRRAEELTATAGPPGPARR